MSTVSDWKESRPVPCIHILPPLFSLLSTTFSATAGRSKCYLELTNKEGDEKLPQKLMFFTLQY